MAPKKAKEKSSIINLPADWQTKDISQLSKTEKQTYLEKVFCLVDVDQSGEIEFEELYGAIRFLGLAASKRTVKLILAEMDQDRSGTVDIDEFLEFFSRVEAFGDLRAQLEHRNQMYSVRHKIVNLYVFILFAVVFLLLIVYLSSDMQDDGLKFALIGLGAMLFLSIIYVVCVPICTMKLNQYQDKKKGKYMENSEEQEQEEYTENILWGGRKPQRSEAPGFTPQGAETPQFALRAERMIPSKREQAGPPAKQGGGYRKQLLNQMENRDTQDNEPPPLALPGHIRGESGSESVDPSYNALALVSPSRLRDSRQGSHAQVPSPVMRLNLEGIRDAGGRAEESSDHLGNGGGGFQGAPVQQVPVTKTFNPFNTNKLTKQAMLNMRAF